MAGRIRSRRLGTTGTGSLGLNFDSSLDLCVRVRYPWPGAEYEPWPPGGLQYYSRDRPGRTASWSLNNHMLVCSLGNPQARSFAGRKASRIFAYDPGRTIWITENYAGEFLPLMGICYGRPQYGANPRWDSWGDWSYIISYHRHAENLFELTVSSKVRILARF